MTTRSGLSSAEPHGSAATHNKWLAICLYLLGAGAAAVAVLGPLASGFIRYHASEGAVNQIIGGDVAGLALVAPVSLAAGVLVWMGHRAGPVLALGPAVYALYMYSQLAIGGDFLRYEGNSEYYFPLYLGLVVLAGAIVIKSWTLIEPASLPEKRRWVDRSTGIFFLVVAFFLTVGLHLPGLLDVWSGEPTSTEYLSDPTVFWLVKFMDLGLVVPALVATGIAVLRRAVWADKVKYALVGWAALLGASVAGMAILMQATGDPAASTVNTMAFAIFALVAIALAGLVYHPLFQRSPTTRRQTRATHDSGSEPATHRIVEAQTGSRV